MPGHAEGPDASRVMMTAIIEGLSDLGYTDVRSYINSGNLIFSSTKTAATLEREISDAIKTTIDELCVLFEL